MENKLTVGNLLDQYGRLVEKGYSNKLVKHYERARIKARKNKIKETNFYFFGNSEYGFFIEITDNWLYKLAEVGFYDLKRGFQYSKSYYKLFSKKDFFISESDNSLENYFKNNKILISIKNFENYKKIYVVAEKFDGKNDFACDLKAFNESSNAIVVSCSLDDEKEFCYFQKSLNYKLEGFLRIENQIYDVAPLETSFKWSRAVMPYINMILTHGGPFKDVDTASYSVQYSAAHGYASGSSGERMPTENAVIEITRQYKEIRLK
ncbi:MAG: DUF2804 family protein [Bacilli bacterium]